MKKILIIQTAFLGDVVLATALVRTLAKQFPDATIDFLLRKGNEMVLEKHPNIRKIHIWDKKNSKIKSLLQLIMAIRNERYEVIVNCHRFLSSGIICFLSGCNYVTGFTKNPLSFTFHKSFPHVFDGTHETDRNHSLIKELVTISKQKPWIHVSEIGLQFLPEGQKFITISPASVWYTKQYPAERWVEFINALPSDIQVVLLGGPADKTLCETIKKNVQDSTKICNLAGRLTVTQSAYIMRCATLNYVNDSAPMHLCSAVNAPVCAVYCSTTPEFGFGPLSDTPFIVQPPDGLKCRPCGIHGHKRCPEKHFDCAFQIQTQQLLLPLQKVLSYQL